MTSGCVIFILGITIWRIWVDIDLGTVKTFDTLILTENIVPNGLLRVLHHLTCRYGTGMIIEPYLHMTVLLEKTIHSLLKRYLHKTFDCLLRASRGHYKNGNQATDPSIRELELYYRNVSKPINIALSKPATASNSHPACPVSDINDGNPSESSRWAASDSTLPAWVEIDLGTPTRVNTLVLSENIVPEWATARISEFALQKWNGSAFETVFTFQERSATNIFLNLIPSNPKRSEFHISLTPRYFYKQRWSN